MTKQMLQFSSHHHNIQKHQEILEPHGIEKNPAAIPPCQTLRSSGPLAWVETLLRGWGTRVWLRIHPNTEVSIILSFVFTTFWAEVIEMKPQVAVLFSLTNSFKIKLLKPIIDMFEVSVTVTIFGN